MTPKLMFDLIPKTAERLGIEEDKLRLIIEKLYKKVKKSVADLDHVQLSIPGLGYFYFKHYVADEELIKYKRNLMYLERAPDTYNKEGRVDFYTKLIQDTERGIELGRLHDARRRVLFLKGKERYFNNLNNDESNTDIQGTE